MIKNKILFFISLILGNIGFGIPFYTFMLSDNQTDFSLGVLFIFGSIIFFTMYTLMYLSLNKNAIIKKIYKIIVTITILLLVSGVLFVILG